MPFERKKDHAKMFTKFNVSKYSLVKKKLAFKYKFNVVCRPKVELYQNSVKKKLL